METPENDPAVRVAGGLTRRVLLRRSGAGLAVLAAGLGAEAGGQAQPARAAGGAPEGKPAGAEGGKRPELTPLQRMPQMMQLYWMGLMAEIERKGLERLREMGSELEARAQAAEVERKIRECFWGEGGKPPERTPLRARTVGRLERAGYHVEKVLFESRLGFLVSANLYLPEEAAGGRRVPGVLGCPGHSAAGKAGESYQAFAQGLVKKGFGVLVFDPIGLGERLDYLDAAGASPPGVGWGVGEHLFAGNQMLLVGENASAWNVWDAMRALDYLLERPEIDGTRVGITGNSGGGMLTTWMCALEPRLTMAAPSCFVTTLRRNQANEEPADTEQCPPEILGAGLDHADFFQPFAPRPLLLLGQEKDFFDVRGFHEARERVEHFYRMRGAEERVGHFVGEERHGYFQANREAMYGWFLRAAGLAGEAKEPEIHLEKVEDLWCAPGGQVANLGSQPVAAFTRAKSVELAGRRPQRTEAELAGVVRMHLDLEKIPAEVPEFRILRPLWVRGYPRRAASVYAVATEPGIEAIVYRLDEESIYSRPPRKREQALLYVSHRSADGELRGEQRLRDLVQADPAQGVYTCDLRGVGESEPNTCRKEFLNAYGPDYFYSIYGVMRGRSYPAQRTWDLLRVLRWVKSHGHEEIHLVAKGRGTIPATFAALISGEVTKVTLIQPLESFASVAETRHYAWFFATFVPGVLRHFDLPDCYRALERKGLTLVEPLHGGEAVDGERLK